jgi:hypothetical protein
MFQIAINKINHKGLIAAEKRQKTGAIKEKDEGAKSMESGKVFKTTGINANKTAAKVFDNLQG